MKAEIKQDGTLEISAETELESYELGKWGSDAYRDEKPFDGSKLLIVGYLPESGAVDK